MRFRRIVVAIVMSGIITFGIITLENHLQNQKSTKIKSNKPNIANIIKNLKIEKTNEETKNIKPKTFPTLTNLPLHDDFSKFKYNYVLKRKNTTRLNKKDNFTSMPTSRPASK